VKKNHTWCLISLWGPVIITMAAIFYVSSMHQAPLPGGLSDKYGHSLAYFTLGLTVVRALSGGLPRLITARVAMLAVAITVAYGVTDEMHQMFVAGRSADIADVYADAAGAVAAAIMCWAWGILLFPPEPSRRSQ
jgi:VanZ family protein